MLTEAQQGRVGSKLRVTLPPDVVTLRTQPPLRREGDGKQRTCAGGRCTVAAVHRENAAISNIGYIMSALVTGIGYHS